MTTIPNLIKIVKSSAQEVYSILGEGYLESVYQQALSIELVKKKIKFSKERNVEILYKGYNVGLYRLDLLVEDALIVETKVARELSEKNTDQLMGYLKTTRWKNGILINFPDPLQKDIEIQVVKN